MGAHLIKGEFQSDEYPTTPRGKVPLSVKDKTAQDLLWEYARRHRIIDSEFSDDLEAALKIAGYTRSSSAPPVFSSYPEPGAARRPWHLRLVPHNAEASALAEHIHANPLEEARLFAVTDVTNRAHVPALDAPQGGGKTNAVHKALQSRTAITLLELCDALNIPNERRDEKTFNQLHEELNTLGWGRWEFVGDRAELHVYRKAKVDLDGFLRAPTSPAVASPATAEQKLLKRYKQIEDKLGEASEPPHADDKIALAEYLTYAASRVLRDLRDASDGVVAPHEEMLDVLASLWLLGRSQAHADAQKHAAVVFDAVTAASASEP